jgi:uncharacterized membrane protein YbhN (UPF0104 family)
MWHSSLARKAYRVGSAALLAAVFGFLAHTVIQQWDNFHTNEIDISWPISLLVCVVIEAFWFCQIFLWRYVHSNLGGNISLGQASLFYFLSNILSFVPGRVANLFGIAAISNRLGTSVVHSTGTLLLFQVYGLLSGATIFALFLSMGVVDAASVPLNIQILGVAIIIGASLVMISPFVLYRVLPIAAKLTGSDTPVFSLSWAHHLRHTTWFAAGWLIHSLSFYFAIEAVIPGVIGAVDFPIVAAVLLGSRIISMLSWFAPSGLGVVEAGVIAGLQFLVPVSAAVMVAVLHRLLSVVLALVSFFIVTWIMRGWLSVSRQQRAT